MAAFPLGGSVRRKRGAIIFGETAIILDRNEMLIMDLNSYMRVRVS